MNPPDMALGFSARLRYIHSSSGALVCDRGQKKITQVGSIERPRPRESPTDTENRVNRVEVTAEKLYCENLTFLLLLLLLYHHITQITNSAI